MPRATVSNAFLKSRNTLLLILRLPRPKNDESVTFRSAVKMMLILKDACWHF